MEPSIEVNELVKGKRVTIGAGVRIVGGKIILGDDVQIGSNVDIEASERLTIGKGSVIRDGTIIHGRDIELGREFYANHHAEIGGGSCFEKTSCLRVGYWFHLGSYTMVNTAMKVTVGNEVGLGRFANLYTHGAYLSPVDGFPVKFAPITIGNRVWLPAATVNPGVTIGDDVVVAVGGVVTQNIPSNSLAVGAPAKVVKEHFPPKPSLGVVMESIRSMLSAWEARADYDLKKGLVKVAGATFDISSRCLEGPAGKESERVRNLLRRIGIRFRYEVVRNAYTPWDA